MQVEDPDFERAERVLAEGPDAVVPRADTSQDSPGEAQAKGRIPVGVFVAAAAAFAFLAFAIHQFAENRRAERRRAANQTHEYDENHDGRPDHFFIYRNGVLSSEEKDRNADGKIDEWEFFDREGKIERVELDENFDGRPDVWYSYKNGMIESSRHDTNFDGRPDAWCSYKNGIVESSRRDADFDGRPDWFDTYENGIVMRADCRPNDSSIVVRRQNYSHGVLREEWVDENQDGIFDSKFLYDPFGGRSERIPIEPAK